MVGLVVTASGVHEASPGETGELSFERLLRTFEAPERLCLGFVARGLPEPSRQLGPHLGRLIQNLSLGWTAIAWTVRRSDGGTERALGPFAPPTPARPHSTFPRGLFLVDQGRWERTWSELEDRSPRSWLEWSEEFYHRQRDLGSVFCDPSIELISDRDFVVTPWKVRSRLDLALNSFRVFVE